MAKTDPGNRDNAGRFVKGKSGNPLGRPKQDTTLRTRCRELTADMVQILETIARDIEQRGGDRVKAAETILAYGHGKPTTHVEINRDAVKRMSDDDLIAKLPEALEVLGIAQPEALH